MKTTSLPCPSLPQLTITHTNTHPPLQLLCRPQLLSLWLPALPQPTNATVACYCLHRKTKRPMENSNVYQRCQLLLCCFVRNMSLPDASSLSFNCAASSALAAWCKRCLTQKVRARESLQSKTGPTGPKRIHQGKTQNSVPCAVAPMILMTRSHHPASADSLLACASAALACRFAMACKSMPSSKHNSPVSSNETFWLSQRLNQTYGPSLLELTRGQPQLLMPPLFPSIA